MFFRSDEEDAGILRNSQKSRQGQVQNGDGVRHAEYLNDSSDKIKTTSFLPDELWSQMFTF